MALDFLDEMARHLQHAGVGTTATDIFTNKQPADPDDCVTLVGATGTNVQEQRDIPEFQLPRFQCIVRAADYNDASSKFQETRSVLHGMIGVFLPYGVNTTTQEYIRVLRCHIDIEGGPLGEDDRGRSEFSATYIAEYEYHDPS